MKKTLIAFGCLLTAIFMVSCGSTPEPEPEPEVKDIVEEVKEEPRVEVPEPEVEPDFSEENSKLVLTVEAARQKALSAGADTIFPEIFNGAESEFSALKNEIQSSPKADYSQKLNELSAKYESLAVACNAQVLREKADKFSLSEGNKQAYEQGVKALEEYSSLGAGASGSVLLEKAKAAFDSMSDVVNNGLKANAARERQKALDAKKDADKVKAGVAKKEEYVKASETFKKADSSYVTGNIEGAYSGYKESKEIFNQLYETIYAKRAAAQALIDAAKQKVNASQSYAQEADSIAPLAEAVAGIEEEGAVLLEEDNFADPETAVIDVEEGVTAKAADKIAETVISAENIVNDVVEQASESVQTEAAQEQEAQ